MWSLSDNLLDSVRVNGPTCGTITVARCAQQADAAMFGYVELPFTDMLIIVTPPVVQLEPGCLSYNCRYYIVMAGSVHSSLVEATSFGDSLRLVDGGGR